MPRDLSIAQTVDTANVVEWAKLALKSSQARVLRVTRILFDDNDHPMAFEEAVLPLERFPGLSPNCVGDIPDIIELAQRHGISLGRAMERISIVPATKRSCVASPDCSRRRRDEARPHFRDCGWRAH